MDPKRCIQSRCERCGKTICTPAVSGLTHSAMYKKYGHLCTSCLTEEEKKDMSAEQLLDRQRGVRRYRILVRIDWNSSLFTDEDKQILQFIASQIFYVKGRPSLRSIMDQLPDVDVETVIARLEKMGILESYFG